LPRPLTAHRIVGSEFVEVLPVAGEHHHARTSRHRDASCQQQSNCDWEQTQFAHYRSPQPLYCCGGGTLIQSSGHFCTCG
jgi:hypothetical protein